MAGRLNKVIELLEAGQVVFGGGMVWTGNADEAMAYADLGYDFIIFEMEHEGFDLPGLRHSLQSLLNRKQIAAQGDLQPTVAPFVRVPPNARERNQWVIKQTLDTGVYGLIVPHMDTVEQAKAAVVASRYPQAEGVADFEPVGERGWWYRLAPRYWGLGVQEYYDVADLWPLDPNGELFFMPIIEGVQGVRNLPAILREVKGISAIWAGPGDLSIELGTRGNMADPRVEEGVQQVLKTCQEFGVPCAVFASPRDVEKRIEQGFRIIISGPSRTDQTLTTGKQVAGR